MDVSVSVKWLAAKTASEMTYIVSGGALNSTQTKPNRDEDDLQSCNQGCSGKFWFGGTVSDT